MNFRTFPVLTALLMGAATTSPALAHSRAHISVPAPATGSVLVHNGAGAALQVRVEGATRTIPANGSARFTVPAGRTTVVATYRQFGVTRTAQTDILQVYGSREAYVVLRPERTGRVMVTNDSARSAQLLDRGRRIAELAPFESRVVTLTTGVVDLALVSGGHTLVARSFTLRAFEEPTLVGRAPTTGLLALDSDMGSSARVYADGRLVETLAPFERDRISLPVGWVRVEVRDEYGRTVEREYVEITPYHVATMDFGYRDRDAGEHPVHAEGSPEPAVYAAADDEAHCHM